MNFSKKKIGRKIVLWTLVLYFVFFPIANTYAQNSGTTGTVNNNTYATSGETLLLNKDLSTVTNTTASLSFTASTTREDQYEPLLVRIYKDSNLNDGDNSGVWDYSTNTVPAGVEEAVLWQTAVLASNTPGQIKEVTFSSLEPNTNYFVVAYLYNVNKIGLPFFSGDWDTLITVNLTLTTAKAVDTLGTVNSVGGSNYHNDPGPDLGCSPLFFATLKNCLGALFYYVLYEPAAALARLAAHFLDFFVYYATNSDSYRSEFVLKAWGVVRDVSNMFFIVALMVLAIRMILDIDKAHVKKTLSVIILVALVINFSLFITRVVIDASNILAKVFYNNISSVDAYGNPTVGESGEKSITIGLTKVIDPVKIVNKPQDNLKNFIFVVFLCFFLMLGMAWIFFTSALFFVGRVISLWFSMIFAPLAFISYAVPFKIPEYGHTEWWSGLFKAAFMAPLFVFFLYITALFGGTLGAIPGDIANADDWFMSVVGELVPFILIFGLLKAAQKIAKEYSGKFGDMVSKTGAVLGTLALGGAGLATAALGRKFIGSQIAKGSQSQKAMDWAGHRMKFDEQLNQWKASSKKTRGAKPTWDQYSKSNGVDRNNMGLRERLGARANYSKLKVKSVEHARHELEETKKKLGYEGVNNNQLGGQAQKDIKDQFLKDHKSEFENSVRNGNEVLVVNVNGIDTIVKGQNEYEATMRKVLSKEVLGDGDKTKEAEAIKDGDAMYKRVDKIDPATGQVMKDSRGRKLTEDKLVLTDQGRKKVENRLHTSYNKEVGEKVKKMSEVKYEHLETEAKMKLGVKDRLSARSDVGTYDTRNLSQIITKMSAKDKMWMGGILGLMVGGIRGGFKSLKLDMGKGQGDWKKDLGSTITEALKKAPSDFKVNVNLSGGGGGGGGHGGGGDHGGGHGGGHGGH